MRFVSEIQVLSMAPEFFLPKAKMAGFKLGSQRSYDLREELPGSSDAGWNWGQKN